MNGRGRLGLNLGLVVGAATLLIGGCDKNPLTDGAGSSELTRVENAYSLIGQHGNATEKCDAAKAVEAAYASAANEKKYVEWRQKREADCAVLSKPSQPESPSTQAAIAAPSAEEIAQQAAEAEKARATKASKDISLLAERFIAESDAAQSGTKSQVSDHVSKLSQFKLDLKALTPPVSCEKFQRQLISSMDEAITAWRGVTSVSLDASYCSSASCVDTASGIYDIQLSTKMIMVDAAMDGVRAALKKSC